MKITIGAGLALLAGAFSLAGCVTPKPAPKPGKFCRFVGNIEICETRSCRNVRTRKFVACPEPPVTIDRDGRNIGDIKASLLVKPSSSCAVVHTDKRGNMVPCPDEGK